MASWLHEENEKVALNKEEGIQYDILEREREENRLKETKEFK